MANEVLVTLEGVKQHFSVKKERGRKATLFAVDGIDLSIFRGETLGLVGESGCGKSTLGKTLLGRHPLTSGTIHFDGIDIQALKGDKLKEFHAKAQINFKTHPLVSIPVAVLKTF